MTMPGTRARCLSLGIVASVWVSVSVSEAYANEGLGSGRLFDPAPATQSERSQLKKENHSRQAGKQTSREKQTARRLLVFNGVVSSSPLHTERSEAMDALWINGYPLDESALPPGVRAVKWRADLQALEVIFSNGSRDYLSPGDSATLEN